jgi:hypothetical protein
MFFFPFSFLFFFFCNLENFTHKLVLIFLGSGKMALNTWWLHHGGSISSWLALPQNVNSAGTVSNQKTSKFFVSHWEEPMAGHVGVKGVY